jgi:hypothetical protein
MNGSTLFGPRLGWGIRRLKHHQQHHHNRKQDGDGDDVTVGYISKHGPAVKIVLLLASHINNNNTKKRCTYIFNCDDPH